jgi:hypothetical protein
MGNTRATETVRYHAVTQRHNAVGGVTGHGYGNRRRDGAGRHKFGKFTHRIFSPVEIVGLMQCVVVTLEFVVILLQIVIATGN